MLPASRLRGATDSAHPRAHTRERRPDVAEVQPKPCASWPMWATRTDGWPPVTMHHSHRGLDSCAGRNHGSHGAPDSPAWPASVAARRQLAAPGGLALGRRSSRRGRARPAGREGRISCSMRSASAHLQPTMPKPRPKSKSPDTDTPYFDATDLAADSYYVGRLDMMGAKAAMSRSIRVAGNFIGKLHVAMLEAPRDNLDALIPTVDGAYIIAKTKAGVLDHLRATIRSLAKGFVATDNLYRQAMVRGGLAYGPVVLGASLAESSKCFALPGNSAYRDTILIGVPVVQAYEVEEQAPPFGVRVHPSARTFAPNGDTPFGSAYWRWWKDEEATSQDKALASRLKESVGRYFAFMREHEVELDYVSNAIDKHQKLAKEYFASV